MAVASLPPPGSSFNEKMLMAKAELRYGKDPVIRRLAQEILVDQGSEIDAMLLWMSENGRPNRVVAK